MLRPIVTLNKSGYKVWGAQLHEAFAYGGFRAVREGETMIAVGVLNEPFNNHVLMIPTRWLDPSLLQEMNRHSLSVTAS